MMQTNPVFLTVVNPAVQTKPFAVIYTGVSATLNLTLTNNSGGPIHMQSSGITSSQFQVFFPLFFTGTEVSNVTLTPPAGWQCVYHPDTQSLNVTYMDLKPFSWLDGGTLLFECTEVVASVKQTSGGFQINPTYMTGTLPSEIPATLTVLNPPNNNSLDLTKVLELSLDSQGSIYVSGSAADPLSNTLFLNFSNVSGGNLFTGTKWSAAPTVTVSFLYGNSAGALAASSGSTGSAWTITPGIASTEGNKWSATGPTAGSGNLPVWTLTPLDLDILQTGTSASITFSFADIVSITPTGHTQMIVQFSNFAASDTKLYNDCVYVLDIVKQKAPPTRGLLNFYGDEPLISVSGPNQPISINLNWVMLYVDSVSLICSYPGIPRFEFDYPNQTGLSHASQTITIPSITEDTPIFFTLQGLDGNGKLLNALQYAVWVSSSVFIDPRNQKAYPTVLIAGVYWMAQNLDWNSPNSCTYKSDPNNETEYGRLYPFGDAQLLPPPSHPPSPTPWRLPSVQDWNNLVAAGGASPYTALMPGGTTGFDAQLGGWSDNMSDFSQLAQVGMYWSTDASGGSVNICKFSSESSIVNTTNQLPSNYFASVRYVRNA